MPSTPSAALADDLIDRDAGRRGRRSRELAADARPHLCRPARRSSFVERGFADVVSRFAIPRAVPDALIEGLAWDAAGRRYATLDDLTGLCGPRRRHGRPHDDAGHGPARAARARARLRPRRRHATDQHRARRRRGRRQRPPLPAARLAAPSPASTRSGWLAAPRLFAGHPVASSRGCSARPRASTSARDPASPRCLPGCRLGINAARLLYREIGQGDPARRRPGGDPRGHVADTQKLRSGREVLCRPDACRSDDLLEPCVPQADFPRSKRSPRAPAPAAQNADSRVVEPQGAIGAHDRSAQWVCRARRGATGARARHASSLRADVYPGTDPMSSGVIIFFELSLVLGLALVFGVARTAQPAPIRPRARGQEQGRGKKRGKSARPARHLEGQQHLHPARGKRSRSTLSWIALRVSPSRSKASSERL